MQNATLQQKREKTTETHIYYSRVSTIVLTLFCLLTCAAGIVLVLFPESRKTGLLILAVAVVVQGLELRKLFTRKPRLILSHTGIEIAGQAIHPWHGNKNERIERSNLVGNTSYYLVYNHDGNEIKISIKQLGITRFKLKKLLVYYRNSEA